MFYFGCRQFKLMDVIKCALGLSKADLKLMDFFVHNSHRWLNTDEMAKSLGLNLSTVQRSVKLLHEKGVLDRKQQNLDQGGYVYFYQSRPKGQIKDIVLGIVSEWEKKLEDELDSW